MFVFTPRAEVRIPSRSPRFCVELLATFLVAASVVTGVNGQGQIHPDASLSWTTLVTGTAGAAAGRAVAVDSSGNIYTTGYTNDGTTTMAFVAEYSSTGTRLAFTTFQAQDSFVTYTQSQGNAIAVDNAGGIYVVGTATDALEGDTDAFIMKFQLDASNNLTAVTGYGFGIGGSFNDTGTGVAVDSAGEATVVGTYAVSATQTAIFAEKLSADGSMPIFASYYTVPGYDNSTGTAIALDSTGDNAYLAGSIQPTGGDYDILVMQIDNLLGGVVYTATMVNPGNDSANGVAVDSMGHAFIAGTLATSSTTTQAFVAEISTDGTMIMAQTPLTIGQTGTAISMDPSTGNVYVAGGAPDAANNLHMFVEKLDNTLSPHDIGVFGGSGTETGAGVAFDPNSGNAYVAGTTTSTNFATDGSTLNGTSDAFVSNVGSFN
jgi:hypothetical protein